MEAFDIFPCQLYDEVFMLFFLPALSQVARHATHTTASSTKRSQLARQLTIPTIGNQPTSSSTQQHRRHNKVQNINQTSRGISSQLKTKTPSIYQVSSYLLQLDTRQLQIIIQLLGTLHTCLPSKRYFQLFGPCAITVIS